ncbi:MAG: hypothetical protein R2744_05055 [Bacteroidales bacterium]
MKKKSALIILLAVSAGLFAQDNPQFISLANKEVIIDGIATEWSLPLPYSDKESSISWSAMNDDHYLYICLQTIDQPLQQKMMRAGMYVMVSSGGKKKIKSTVNFPLKSSSPGQQNRPTDGEGRIDRLQMRQEFIESSKEMKLKGFRLTNGTVPNLSESGISAALSWEAQFLMTYELRIPLEELFGESFNRQELETALSIRIVVNPIPQPAQQGYGTSDPTAISASRGGERGSRGAGTPSRSGMGQGPARTELFTPTTIRGEILLNRGEAGN